MECEKTLLSVDEFCLYVAFCQTFIAHRLNFNTRFQYSFEKQRTGIKKSLHRFYINTALINWNCKLAIPLKHIIFTEPFIAGPALYKSGIREIKPEYLFVSCG